MATLSEDQAGLQFQQSTSIFTGRRKGARSFARAARVKIACSHSKLWAGCLLIAFTLSIVIVPNANHAQSPAPLPDGPHVMTFTYYSVKGEWDSLLTLNNSADDRPLTASTILYALDGTPLHLPDVALQPLQNIGLRLGDLIAQAGAVGSFQEGSAEVFFDGPAFGIGAQMTVADRQGRSFDMEPAMGFKSSRLEGLWWSLDDKADGRVMLSNTSDQSLDVLLNLEWKGSVVQARSLTLSPHQTSVQNIKQLLNELHLGAKGIERGGISIVHNGHPGDLTAHGVIEDKQGRFASNIAFIDPAAQPETPLEANGLMLAHPLGSAFPGATFFTPVLALKNSSGSAQVATVTVQYTVNGGFQSKSLPAVSIAPHDVVMVDFTSLLAKLRSASIESAGLKIQSSRRGALLVAQLTSIDQNQSMCVDALVERVPGGFVGKGAHPFHLDGDNQGIVYLKNLSDTKTTAIVEVLYDGGEFSPELVHLGPGQSVAVDVRRLRDSQAVDIHGDKLPLELEHGQVQWFQRGKQSVVGHLISFSASRGVSSSFACPALCCPPDYLSSKVNPSTITGLPGESFTVTVTERRFSQCNRQVVGPYDVTSESFIYSSNPNVAQVSGNTVTLLNGGTAQISADLTAFDFGGDTSDCPMPINTRTCAPTCSEFDFPATTDSSSAAKTQVPTSLSQTIGPLKTYNGTPIVAPDGRVLASVAYGYSRLINFTVLDQDGQQIKRSGMTATEDVVKVSSNPSDIDGNFFLSGVTVNSNGQFGDIQAFFKTSPPLPQPGEFLKQKQRIDIQRPGIAWTVRWNCINKQSNDVTITITNLNGNCQ